MKKQFLNLGKALTKAEQKSINGGGSYSCYCGFVGGPYEDFKVLVDADSVEDALNSMNCGGEGVTCNGQ
ncbi:MAG: hypothetical protein JJE44_10525 [Flavobacteriaceae bacterium]|nr:hypothetical protein [Flavobacteriaceae bacterium]